MTPRQRARDVLEPFCEAGRRRMPRRGRIGLIVARGHWRREVQRFWYDRHRDVVTTRQKAKRLAAEEARPCRVVQCPKCGEANAVPEGRTWPIGGWCCDAMRSPSARSHAKRRARERNPGSGGNRRACTNTGDR